MPIGERPAMVRAKTLRHLYERRCTCRFRFTDIRRPGSNSFSRLEAKTKPLGAMVARGKSLSGPESPHPYNFLTGNNDRPMFSTPEKYLMFLKEGFDLDVAPLSSELQLVTRLPV